MYVSVHGGGGLYKGIDDSFFQIKKRKLVFVLSVIDKFKVLSGGSLPAV